jgi:hypothetical protein
MSETVVKYYIAAIPFYSKVFLLKNNKAAGNSCRLKLPDLINYVL